MINQARNLMTALEVSDNADNLSVAVEVIELYGSYRSAMHNASKIEFKKKEALLFSLLGNQDDNIIDDKVTKEANQLIDMMRATNDNLNADAYKMNLTFSDLLSKTTFKNLSDREMSILSEVRPHYSLKQLVSNINHYQTGLEALNAFKTAIKKIDKRNSQTISIESNKANKMLHMKQRNK